MRAINLFFQQNHNAIFNFGVLIALCFLTIYLPSYQQKVFDQKVNILLEREQLLRSEIDGLSSELQFSKLSYQQQEKMHREVTCLAKNIYFEAGAEPRAGKIAVAEVTMNRVKNRNYPRSVCGVVYQKYRQTCQFSWVCENKRVATNSKTWQDSVKIAENILISKKKYSIIGSATHFHADYVYPNWAETKQVVATIGNHIFYR